MRRVLSPAIARLRPALGLRYGWPAQCHEVQGADDPAKKTGAKKSAAKRSETKKPAAKSAAARRAS